MSVLQEIESLYTDNIRKHGFDAKSVGWRDEATHRLRFDKLVQCLTWIPHSYAGCSQHAPDEHLLAPIAREGLGAMAGLFWDLGEPGIPRHDQAARPATSRDP